MISNWNKSTTTTTGTGTLTLSAVSGRPLPSAAHAVGELVEYSVQTSDGQFESGIGTIAASNTLERTTVLSTYNGTTYNKTTATALNLPSGTHTVIIAPIAELLPIAGKNYLRGASSPSGMPLNSTTGQVFIGLSARKPQAWPYLVGIGGVVSSLQIIVSTQVAGSSIAAGIYEQKQNGLPGRLLTQTASAFDTTSTGVKTQSVNNQIRLNPGWYFIGLVEAGGSPSIYGYNMTNSVTGASSFSSIGFVRHDVVSTSLPSPFPETTLVYNSGNNQTIPAVGLVMT